MNRLRSKGPVSLALATLLMLVAAQASAQQGPIEPRPVRKGIKRSISIDSSPQQAAIYLDDRKYGVVGYTPYKGVLVEGDYKLILELRGFQTVERTIRVQRNMAPLMIVLERQVLPGTISVMAASDPNLNGAQITIDGQPHGTVPGEVKLPAGRHLVELSKEGFNPFSQWIEVAEGQLLTLAPVLKPMVVEKAKGSLLIDANVPGAEVILDGRKLDEKTPLVVDALEEGSHLVEVFKSPATPWKQTVYVRADERTRVTAELLMPQAPAATVPAPSTGPGTTVAPSGPVTTGTLDVAADVPGAEVFIDGALAGNAPVSLKQVPAGSHEVEVRAPGHTTAKRRIQVPAGQAVTVEMSLPREVATTGTLRVVSSVPEAVVFIDGARVGMVPVEKQLPAGKHFVLVTRDGFSKFEQEITVVPGSTLDVNATLLAAGRLRVVASENGAQAILDGAPVGVTPLDLATVEAGEHVVDVKLEGFHDFRTTVKVLGGQTSVVNADLQKRQTALTPEEQQIRQRGLSSWGARPMDLGNFTVDLATGYPYLGDLRAIVGVSDADFLGWDVGVGVRTYFNNWELYLTSRLRLLNFGPFSLGVFGSAGGGDGTQGRNSMFLQAGGLASLHLGDLVTISGRAFLDAWSDRLCPAPGSDEGGIAICGQDPATYTPEERKTVTETTGLADARDLADQRDTGARFYLSLAIEAGIWQHVSLFAIFEGAPGQDPRAAHSELFNSHMFLGDDPIYNAKLGATLKF